MNRRSLLQGALASWLIPPGLVTASVPGPARSLVVVVLRGGLDALAMVPAHGDKHLNAQRRTLAPGTSLYLDADFSLMPRLRGVHGLYRDKELCFVHALSTPYRGRSHFDAQQVLESGGEGPFALSSGWLGRVARHLGTPSLSLSRNPPLILRGDAQVRTWSRPVRVEAALLDRIELLYEGHDWLSARLHAARSSSESTRGKDPFAAAADLAESDATQLAVIEGGGWDTHARQERDLDRRFKWLDEGLVTLKEGLADRWKKTAVLVVSEFGRAVRPNGSGGTDHGTATLAILAGGAVRGGRVIADWPGLAPRQLFEGRDLRPTLDTRSLIASVLEQHLAIDPQIVRTDLVPDAPPEARFESLLAG